MSPKTSSGLPGGVHTITCVGRRSLFLWQRRGRQADRRLRAPGDGSQVRTDVQCIQLPTDKLTGRLIRWAIVFSNSIGEAHQLARHHFRLDKAIGSLFGQNIPGGDE